MTVGDFIRVFEKTDFEMYNSRGYEITLDLKDFFIIIQSVKGSFTFNYEQLLLDDNKTFLEEEIAKIETIRTTGCCPGNYWNDELINIVINVK